ADRLAVAHLEGGDRLARLGDHRLLTRDQPEIGGCRLDLLAIVDALADAHIDHDLLQARHFHLVLVAALLRELLAPDLVEMRTQARRPALHRPARLLLAGLGLWRLVALLRLALAGRLGLLAALCFLAAGFRLRRLVRLLGLAALAAFSGLVVFLSHRSLLP